jgi:hypothetical protein
MKRGRLLVVTATFASLLTAFAACTIPSLEFVPSEGGSPDSPSSDAPTDGGSDAPVGANEDVDPTGRDAEAGLADVVQLDAASLDAACCDCDGDGFIGIHPPDAGCPTPPAGKVDCDDYIPAINPDASFLLNDMWTSTHVPKFDWNCDKNVTKQLPHDLSCACLTALCSCSDTDGFKDDPGCGVTQNYFQCSGGIGCSFPSLNTRTQGCK